jgi:hypothetical protein
MPTATTIPCQFCKQRPGDLLCDGRLEDGRTCSANVCRQCAKEDARFHCLLSRRHPVTRSRTFHETVDRCPTCVRLNRKTNWGGVSENHARQIVEEVTERKRPSLVKGGQRSLFSE